MGKRLSVISCDLNGFEGLHQAVQGSHVDVMQLRRGVLRGTLSHVGIDDFSLSIGSFNLGVRTQRTSSDEKLIVGMLLSAEDRVTHFAFDMRPADVLVIPPAVEHDGIFHGASSYAALRFDLADVASIFAGEARLSDPATWCEKNRYRADPAIAKVTTGRLPQIVSHLAQHQHALTEASADFWKRTIVDCITATIFQSLPPDEHGTLPSALRLVHKVEDYLAAAGARPVHVSELCAAFRVSRRGLHRAFHDAFGIGPVTFLRHKRLCAIHSALKDSSPDKTTVTEIALQQGFVELGRFSHYYRALFGEYPSETLGLRGRRAALAH
jgi:AraC-like DNA-binding protein